MARRVLPLLLAMTLAGCATLPPPQVAKSPCEVSEASMACQIERYNNVNVQ